MSGAPAAAVSAHGHPRQSPLSGPRQRCLMLRREKAAQVAKNVVAERKRVIELGEDASYSPSPAFGRAFRDGLRCEARKVVLN